MKKWLLAVMMIVPLLMSAQNAGTKYQIKGQAVDSLTQEAMPYVTCHIRPHYTATNSYISII